MKENLIIDLEQSQSISLAKNILRAETAAIAGSNFSKLSLESKLNFKTASS